MRVSLAIAVLALAAVAGPAYADNHALPTKVVVRDGATSPAAVDITTVTLESSWYWASQQVVRVKLPGGARAGQRLTIWFDVDGDAAPEGRYDLWLKKPTNPARKYLRLVKQVHAVGDWSLSGGTVPAHAGGCGDEEGGLTPFDVKKGAKSIDAVFDVFWCFGGTPADIDADPGVWRASVRLAKGKQADMAPSAYHWSPAVRGWKDCDPSGGSC